MTAPIDYDALLAKCKRVASSIDPREMSEEDECSEAYAADVIREAAAAIRALRAAAVESERDAARYRWLRDGENGGDLSIGDMTEIGDEGWERVTWLYEEELDTAMDAAMAAQEKAHG